MGDEVFWGPLTLPVVTLRFHPVLGNDSRLRRSVVSTVGVRFVLGGLNSVLLGTVAKFLTRRSQAASGCSRIVVGSLECDANDVGLHFLEGETSVERQLKNVASGFGVRWRWVRVTR